MPPKKKSSGLFVSGSSSRNSEYQVLTPRTPHSRAGRAEEGFTEVELNAIREDEVEDYRTRFQQQSQPLLSRSDDKETFPAGYRSRGDDEADRSVKSLLRGAFTNPAFITGLVIAAVLLVLTGISWSKPGVLEEVLLQPGTNGSELAGEQLTSDPATKSGAQLLQSTSDVELSTSPSSTVDAPEESSTAPTMAMPAMKISYENYTTFPLTGNQYRHECALIMNQMKAHPDYWDQLPSMVGVDVPHHDDPRICTKTLTYQLDGTVGLTADLALLAQAAALARERNRTFLVDDTYWTRGKWTDHFEDVRETQPGPEPGCLPPPPEELVACPRFARHWVVNSRTAVIQFGHGFQEHYHIPIGHGLNRLKTVFQQAADSFRDTIKPNHHNLDLIKLSRKELAERLGHSVSLVNALEPDSSANPSPYIAVHIRRGDLLGDNWWYHTENLPMELHVKALLSSWPRLFPDAPISQQDSTDAQISKSFPAPPFTYIASDSPDAVNEFASSFPPETGIFSLERSWSQDLRALSPKHAYVQAEFNEEQVEERIRLTRGMIVDLAMISGFWAEDGDVVPGATVCGIATNVCRLAALGYGFDRAFGFDDDGDHYQGETNHARRRWVEIDNNGTTIPQWEGYGLF